jgi:basic membrane protein A
MRTFTLKLFSLLVVSTLALAACGGAATAAATAAPTAKPFRIGLVTDVGKIDDHGFLQASWEGVQMAQTQLGAQVKYIQTTDPKDFDKNIAQFADAGYDVVVCAGFGLVDATMAAAKKYPNVKFLGIAVSYTDALPPNLITLNHPEDQAGFLGGALAAMMSKSGILGSVQATDAVPAVWRYGEGFRAGAKYIKPDIQINVIYHSDVGFDKTFNDPEWGKTTAISMIAKGADVIFAGASDTGNGALEGAAQKGTYAIGMDVDAYEILPDVRPVMLSSSVKLIRDDSFKILQAAMQGQWTSGNVLGQVGLAPYHDLDSKVPADVKTKMDTILQSLRDGSLKTNVPPTKPSS